MNAILVSVDMADLASITIPWNRHHFKDMTVVTSTKDAATEAVAKANNCQVFKTDLFWYKGSEFAKWRSLEEALRETGLQDSHDWLAILDVDILWPKVIPASGINGPLEYTCRVGNLYGPYRRMWREWPNYPPCLAGQGSAESVSWQRRWQGPEQGKTTAEKVGVPDEQYWCRFSLSPQQTEWAGFSLILHPDDPVLQQRPWFDVSWRSCSGADSFLQMRWEGKNKVRPPWEVLHLGEDHINWLGRTSPYADGTMPKGAAERKAKLREMMGKRRNNPNSDKFSHEKIKE